MKPSNSLESKIPSGTYWRAQLLCMKVQNTSSEQPEEYNQTFVKSRLVMTFLTKLEVTWILCCFRFVLEGKSAKEIPKSSRFEFLETFFTNKFAFSVAEDNTCGPLNRGGIVDLPLLTGLVSICQKSWEPSFWDVIVSFVLVA